MKSESDRVACLAGSVTSLVADYSACVRQVEDSVSGIEAPVSDSCWQKFQQRFNEIVRDVIRFAKFIPGFTELDLNDQISLLKGAGFEVVVVALYHTRPVFRRLCQPWLDPQFCQLGQLSNSS